jgi:hypothetical protein
MRRVVHLTLTVLLAVAAPWLHAQDQKAEIQKRLSSQFVLTKTTADRSDIVGQPGSVIVLHKDNLVMFSLDSRVMPTITYKDGKLSMGFGDSLSANIALNSVQQGTNVSNVAQRKFVAGEKFWITGIVVTDKHVILQLYTDPYADVRYFGQLKFPYKKNNIPPADEMMNTVAEVVTAEPADNTASTDAASQKAPAPIKAPPPPADTPTAAPKTVALGQTKDQVVATFGQPPKAATLGAKEIYYYPDMKVTFVNGKVTDVQ